MGYILSLSPRLKDELWRHLLPEDSYCEQAAFLYATHATIGDDMVFDVVAHELLENDDFTAQCSDYLELADEARARIIKRAYAVNGCIVEIHSHPWGDSPAEFSVSDRVGLKQTVPHVRWRLMERPYLALVVGLFSYDALIWALGDQPAPLVVQVGRERLLPTGRSLGSWDGRK